MADQRMKDDTMDEYMKKKGFTERYRVVTIRYTKPAKSGSEAGEHQDFQIEHTRRKL